MSQDKTEPGDRPMGVSPSEDLGARSVLMRLAPEGGLEGIGLRGLDDEPPMPEVGRGPEKYQVVRTLGEGGMGKVYAVLDRDLKRPVALKMIRPGRGSAAQQRFLEEAQVMAQLQHPNILPVHEMGLSEESKPYYTMPLVHGRSLKTVLEDLKQGDEKTRRTFSLTRLVQVFLQVAQAISYAHAKGVLHRDIKPANVMLGEHGEVQVIDWGMASVIDGSEVKTDLAASRIRSGQLVGTPAYMSPEQARREEVDARTDVYALGVMLYELLTWELPFRGTSMAAVLAAVVGDPPVPPRERSRQGSIPAQLERACLQALAKQPSQRQPSVEALHGEVQAWLETEVDQEKRRERAQEMAAEGGRLLGEYQWLKGEVERLQAEALEIAKRFEPWQPIEEKAPLIAAEDVTRATRQRLVEAAADAVGALELTLGFDRENATARELLADYYWDRFLEAEKAGSESDVEFFRRRVAAYHSGKYARELVGDGSLALTSDPPGAEVWVYDLVEEGFVVVEENLRRLGVTPLPETPLAMGSYLAVLKKEGFRDVRYPVHITRQREWVGRVRMCTEGEIGAGFVFVPGGPCVVGGDWEAYGSLPRKEITVVDYFLAEHPVTMGEYLQYVNDVARREGLAAARRTAPRRAPHDEKSYLLEDGAGGLKLPEVDTEGDRWDPRWPASGISWHDAVAYCGWRSARDGRGYRLPSQEEWEKAARGVDGRWYPWGWRFDATLCNMIESRRNRPAPVPVEEFPTDVSVYGVKGLGGNVRDWTSNEEVWGTGDTRRVERVIRGGHWCGHGKRLSRAAYRYFFDPTGVDDSVGLRLARSL